MYLSFFGLNCKPFQLSPDPDFFFRSKEHQKTLTHLSYGLTFNQGFILITGEVGIGKTTIIRKVIKQLGKDIKLAKITNTRVSSDQLWALINDDFGLDATGKDKIRMLKELTDFLINEYSQGRRCMLFVDEAQNLSAGLLEEIRLLSNLETDKAKLLQIILVGQPELRQTLSTPELRQLRQRINVSCHLNALSKEETASYIFHRLEAAGNREAAVFEAGAIDAIYAFSRGIPRLVNIICDFLFLSAFVEGARTISAGLTREVIGEMEQECKYWNGEAEERKKALLSPDAPGGDMQEVLFRLKRLELAAQGTPRAAGAAEAGMRTPSVEAALADMQEKLVAAGGSLQKLEKIEKNVQDRLDALEKKIMRPAPAPHPEGKQEKPGGGGKSNKRLSLWKRIFD